MTDKVTLTNLANLQNETTAVNAINSNNAAIIVAMDNTLSRDGTSPNQMGNNLDMNSFRIINLPAPIVLAEPLRLADLNSFVGGSLTINSIPVGGTANQVLSKNSSVNYDVSWQSALVNGTAAGGDLAGTYVNPTIALNAVTYAKMQQNVALAITGNATNSTANVAAIAATAGTGGILAESGSALAFRTTLSGNYTWSGTQNITNATASTTPTTGALKVAGGLGVAGRIYAGDFIQSQGPGSGYVVTRRDTNALAYIITSQSGTFTVSNFVNDLLDLNTSGMTIGTPGVFQGNLNLSGSSSGSVSINPQAAAGTYNFNLPISAGSAGQPLISGGGGSTAQSYATQDAMQVFLGTRLSENDQVGTSYTFLSTDNQKYVTQSNPSAIAVTLPQAGGSFPNGWWTIMENLGAGVATVTPTTSTINGAATLPMGIGNGYLISSDGNNYQALQTGNWSKTLGSVQIPANFTVINTGQGNLVNATGNGTVLGANVVADSIFIHSNAHTHIGNTQGTAAFINFAPGSASDASSNDNAIIANCEQNNYLTTTNNGEFDTIAAFSRQGVNATGDVFFAQLNRRATAGAVAGGNDGQIMEFDTRLLNGSGDVAAGWIARGHGTIGSLRGGDTTYGTLFGAEAQVGVWRSGFLVDTLDLSTGTAGVPPNYTYAIYGRKARDDTKKYFSISTLGKIRLSANTGNTTVFDGQVQASSMIAAAGADNADCGMSLFTFGSGLPYMSFFRNAGSLAAPSGILTGSSIGQFQFGGYDGTAFNQTGGLFNASASENWTAAHHGTLMSFYTTPTTTTATVEAMRINPSGGISIGLTTDFGIGTIAANTFVKTGVTTVAALPAASATNQGARYFVTDSNAATYTAGIGAIVAAGGTTKVPVTSDGTNWRIG